VTIRLYLEEDSMRRALVRALSARGVDVVTARGNGEMALGEEELEQIGGYVKAHLGKWMVEAHLDRRS